MQTGDLINFNPHSGMRFPNPYDLPDNIFCIMSGKTGSGKTNYLANLLVNLDNNGNQILPSDEIHICSPSINQPIYQKLKKLKENCPGICGELHYYKSLSEMPSVDQLSDEGRKIIVFDDVMNDKQQVQTEYFTRGRHKNIDLFYLVQSFFKIPNKGIRDNANVLMLFPPITGGSDTAIWTQYRCGTTYKNFTGWLNRNLGTPHIPKVIIPTSRYKKFRDGIDNI